MSVLSDQQLYGLTQKHFGDLGQGVVNTMFEIAKRESGGNSSAYNGAGLDRSHGIWQINVHPEANPDLAGMNLQDPEQNARAARLIYDRQGPTAWTTYTPDQEGQEAPQEVNLEALNATINALINGMPDPSQYKDAYITTATGQQILSESAMDQYKEDLAAMTDTITKLQQIRQNETEKAAGVFRMEDGMILSQAQIDEIGRNDPAAMAQIQTYIANKNIDNENAYNAVMNDIGLTEFTTARAGVEMENTRLSNKFQNELDEIREHIALDLANQDTTVRKAERHIKGMQEASTRSRDSMDALMKAAPWATSNGKTNFTAADLGMPEAVAGMGGFAPGADILRYTGTQTIDPVGALGHFDQALGVEGPIPQIADLNQQWAGMIPQAPDSIPIPKGSPTFTPPQRYQPTPMPQATTPPPVSLSAAVGSAPPIDPRQMVAMMQQAIAGNIGRRTAQPMPQMPQIPQLMPLTDILRNQYGLRR